MPHNNKLVNSVGGTYYLPSTIGLGSIVINHNNEYLKNKPIIMSKLNEKSPYMPMNDYAVSKVSMELMANIWKDKLPITITRPFNYTGIGQSENFLIPKIISHFKKKKKSIELGNLEIYRDFSDVRDIAEIYAELMEINPVGETFNLCSGSCISIKQIIEII